MIGLLVLSLSVVSLGCQAAPATYDQRQEGGSNVRADLENLLFVFVTKGSLINDIALFDFKSMAKQMLGHGNKNEPIMSENEDLGERSKTGKPYQVDIVKIPKDKERGNDVIENEPVQLVENKSKKIDATEEQNLKTSEAPSKDSKLAVKEEGQRTSTGHVESAGGKYEPQEAKLRSDRSKLNSNA